MNTETVETEPEIQLEDEHDDPIVHRAICAQCRQGVTFKPTASGSGFIVIGHTYSDVETFGIGPSGYPMCPEHGEMTLADETLPVADAFAKVNGELLQQSLPGVFPAFNYQGAWEDVVAKVKERDRLKVEEDDAHEEYKEAKKAREKCDEVINKMITEYERRRREKQSPAPSEDSPNLVRCYWEQIHVGETCPVCTSDTLSIEPRFGASESEQHAAEVSAYIVESQIQRTIDLLQGLDFIVVRETVLDWTTDDLADVQQWADAAAGKELRERFQDLPKALGRPHVIAGWIRSEEAPGDTYVECEECGARLFSHKTGDGEDLPHYPAGTRIGTDCTGKPARQIKRRKAKASK